MTHRKRNDDWTDEHMIWALQARDAGITMAQIGWKLGRTRNAVAGMLNRIDRELAALEAYWKAMDIEALKGQS